MSQPVRKVIQEVHPDLIKEPPTLTMLVDGNSLLFSSFADDKVNSDGVVYGPIFQFLLQIRMMLTKNQFDKIVVFFDSSDSGALRYQFYPPYKENRNKHYENTFLSDYMKAFNANLKNMQSYIFNKKKKQINKYYRYFHEDYVAYFEVLWHSESKIKINFVKRKYREYKSERSKNIETSDNLLKISEVINKQDYDYFTQSDWDYYVSENFDRCRDTLCEMFNELSIRWTMDKVVEGDDLIAYYCLNKKPNEKIIIISSDMDLCQLLTDDVSIYNQVKKLKLTNKNFKEQFGYPSENVLIKKIFCGDTSDNIGNIKGLSETGFFELMPEAKEKKVTIDEVKERAKQLIDERVANKKKPLLLHENILNGVSNKQYDGDFYEINKLIIDLNNPLLTDEAKDEMDNTMNVPLDMSDRNAKNLIKIIYDNKLEEIQGDTKFASFFAPFKRIEEKEREFFEKSF